MSDEAPERMWVDPDILPSEWDKRYHYDVEYVRADRIEKLETLIKDFFTLLDITEETDEGRVFHPNRISSCRALDAEKLDQVLTELKRTIENG